MVGEFPELQGAMGRQYALAHGETRPSPSRSPIITLPPDRRTIVRTRRFRRPSLSRTSFDTLAGFFAIGETPTGSRDPYALRRAALGVIRLILENGLRLPLQRRSERR